MTREEILSKQTITNFSGVEFVKPHNALIAMQEYADQETQRIKAELAYKDKEIEISHNENRRMERHFLETVTVINSLRELQTEDLKQLQSELTELKEKHKYDENDMLQAAKYGYVFRDTTSFPEHKFEDSCINNTKQWLIYYKETHKTK